MTGSWVETGMEVGSHCSVEGVYRRERSHSDRTMRKKLSSSLLEAYAVWNFSGRKFKWGNQVKKKSKIIPT
jgi:hypothetical protein